MNIMIEYNEYYDLSDDIYLINYFNEIMLPKLKEEQLNDDKFFITKYSNLNYIVETKDDCNSIVFSFTLYKTISNSVMVLRSVNKDIINIYLRKYKLKKLYEK